MCCTLWRHSAFRARHRARERHHKISLISRPCLVWKCHLHSRFVSKLENGQWRIIEELDYKKREGGQENEKKKEYNWENQNVNDKVMV